VKTLATEYPEAITEQAKPRMSDLEERLVQWRAVNARLVVELDNAQATLGGGGIKIDMSTRRAARKSARRLTQRVGAERLVQYAEERLITHKQKAPR